MKMLKVAALLLGAVLLGWLLGACSPVDATASMEDTPTQRLWPERWPEDNTGVGIVADSLTGVTCYTYSNSISCVYTGLPDEETN